jgi:energy-coupling factor transport system ATP-binding protein
MSENPIISFRDVSFSYEEEAPVLEHYNLDIESGSFVAILGHNGCGKSTAAKLMNGILVPTSGKVLVEGIDTANEDDLLEVRRRVGMVFQNPDNQIVANVVEEDVAFALENLGVPSEEIRRRVDEALELVGMTAYVRHAPHLLSGGQKQRIAIAGVVAMRPKCIVVLITHHMDEAARAQRLIVMHKGEICKDGAPSQVFRDIAGMEELGLSVPETYQLLDGLRQAGWDIPMEGLSAQDCAETITQFLEKRGQSIGAHH